MADILIVDDNASLRRLLKRRLERAGHAVLEASTGRGCLRLIRTHRPSLVILDWVLGPPFQGVDICKSLKASAPTRAMPVIILTGAKVDFEDELKALECGADLYLTKDVINSSADGKFPLIRYVDALFSRVSDNGKKAIWQIPGLEINFAQHTVKTSKGVVQNLSTKEFDLLRILAKAYPKTVARPLLVKLLWNGHVRDREVDVMVSRIRAKIQSPKTRHRLIESVVNQGYRLSPPSPRSR